MPRITVNSGVSNAAARPGEVGHFEHAPQAPVAPGMRLVAETGPEAVPLPQGTVVLPAGWTTSDAPDAAHEARNPVGDRYEGVTKASLVRLAAARGLPVSGSKAHLAARLAEHAASDAQEGEQT